MPLRSQTQRTLLLLFIGSIGGCGLVGIYCLVLGSLGELAGRVLAMTFAVGTASILAMSCAILWERRRWPSLGLCGLIAVTAALGLVLLAIWLEPYEQDWFYRTTFIACVVAVAIPHVGLLSLARLRRQYEWSRFATIAVITVLVGQIIGSIVSDIGFDWWYRIMGVLGILNVCGTVTVPVLHRVSAIPPGDPVQTVSSHVKVSLTCPRCETPQVAPIGASRCGQCGLKFSIQIEEQHCPQCGYALYRHAGAACPECGATVASVHAAPCRQGQSDGQ